MQCAAAPADPVVSVYGAYGRFLKHLLTLSHALGYIRRFTARTLLAHRVGAAHS
ncbi:hypothetical protein C4J96_1151 [Pseudomonas orientalis]|nr:hypothetical protein C4J96_1151 [Pseudomonas orientalis]